MVFHYIILAQNTNRPICLHSEVHTLQSVAKSMIIIPGFSISYTTTATNTSFYFPHLTIRLLYYI